MYIAEVKRLIKRQVSLSESNLFNIFKNERKGRYFLVCWLMGPWILICAGQRIKQRKEVLFSITWEEPETTCSISNATRSCSRPTCIWILPHSPWELPLTPGFLQGLGWSLRLADHFLASSPGTSASLAVSESHYLTFPFQVATCHSLSHHPCLGVCMTRIVLGYLLLLLCLLICVVLTAFSCLNEVHFIESRDLLSYSLLYSQLWSRGLSQQALSGYLIIHLSISSPLSALSPSFLPSLHVSIYKMAWPCGVRVNLLLQLGCGRILIFPL